MAVQVETSEDIALRAERGMALARQIIKDSWHEVGLSEEQWERSPIYADVHEGLMRQGLSAKEAENCLDAVSWEEVQRTHREMYPRRYETK
jgi:hypothetical protein